MKINTCSVTVMRSHDYCHFSVTLGATMEDFDDRLPESSKHAQVDKLRKEAARLADKAVRQYQRKKRALELEAQYDNRLLRQESEKAHEVPEGERTPDHLAAIKAYKDRLFESRYDYEDED